MRRIWLWLPTVLVVSLAFLPAVSHAAGFVSVIPAASTAGQAGWCTCTGSAPDFGCVLQTLQNLMNDFVTIATLFITVLIAWAGITYILNPTNPEKRSQANARILNAIIGLVIVLCAWLLVDTVMKVLYNPTASNWGPWNTILTHGINTGDQKTYCIQSPKNVPTLSSAFGQLVNPTNPQGGTVPVPNQVGVTKGLCSDSNTSCSVGVLESDGLSSTEAQAMSCIAVTESAGGYNKPNSGTGAEGLFQITGQNWNNPAFHSGSCSSATSRQDDTCNRQTAELMLESNVGYQPWTGKCNNQSGCGNVSYGQYWNPNAVACVQKYDPNTTKRTS